MSNEYAPCEKCGGTIYTPAPSAHACPAELPDPAHPSVHEWDDNGNCKHCSQERPDPAPPKDVLLDELNAIGNVVGAVVSARKGSIGSIDNVYLPQIRRDHGDAACKALKSLRERLAAHTKGPNVKSEVLRFVRNEVEIDALQLKALADVIDGAVHAEGPSPFCDKCGYHTENCICDLDVAWRYRRKGEKRWRASGTWHPRTLVEGWKDVDWEVQPLFTHLLVTEGMVDRAVHELKCYFTSNSDVERRREVTRKALQSAFQTQVET